MAGKKLKNAPLKEAIFELYWELPTDATGFPIDEEFDIALGKFASKIKNSYPVTKRLLPPGVSLRMYHKASHQFWKGEFEWPVLQLGHGMLTVNETDKNYNWEETYRPNVENAIKNLLESYPNELKFNKIRLLYIDAADYDPNSISPEEFVSKNLLTSIHTGFNLPGKQININIGQSFSLGNKDIFYINIQNGLNNLNGNPAIVWTTSVERNNFIPKEELLDWLNNAHTVTSEYFVNMLNPEFYASFDK